MRRHFSSGGWFFGNNEPIVYETSHELPFKQEEFYDIVIDVDNY